MNEPDTVVTASTLYVVPTPIGNLDDITYRALKVLKNVDFIAAEDTRNTRQLLKHFAINTLQLSAFYDHNEKQKTDYLLKKLQDGQSIALVSDAGTPLINDPGYYLVRRCRESTIRVIPLPGACAAITALSAAGVASNRFCYEGFLPAKKKGRQDTLQSLLEEPRSLIFFEAPHRLIESLQDMISVFGAQRYVVLARELTKKWESIYGAPVGELLDWVQQNEYRQRGEMVLIVEGYQALFDDALPQIALHTLALLRQMLPLKTAAKLTAEIHNVNKNSLYRHALNSKQDKINSS